MSALLRCIFTFSFFVSSLICFHAPPSRSNVDSGKRMKQTENIQEPQNYGDNHDAVQNGLDGSLHGNEAIHQPQKNPHHDENFQELN